jgi:L-fucose isomerase-like protein
MVDVTSCDVLPLASSLHDSEAIGVIAAQLAAPLADAGGAIVDSVGAADATRPLALLVLTGGTEQAVLQAVRRRHQEVSGEPVVLLAHPEHNSLPAALEAMARLHRDGNRGRIVTIRPAPARSPERGDDALAAAVHDVEVWHRLHRARIGVIGDPSDWLVASSQPGAAIRRRWGPTLAHVNIGSALERLVDIDADPDRLAVPVRLGARHVNGPTTADIDTAARLEPVLTEIVERDRLDAVAVRCFDLVLDAHTSGCLALSALNDRGVIAGCEGDIASTVALLWAKYLVGQVGWMANPADIHADSGTIELAHCTVARTLVEHYDLRTHFESGLGVGIAGDMPPGPVTLLRLGGAELERCWCVDGEALATTPRPDRCRTQLDVRVTPAIAAALLDDPLGNHLVVIRGHHAALFHRWWKTMISPLADAAPDA